MTPEDLQEIKAELEKITPGPWEKVDYWFVHGDEPDAHVAIDGKPTEIFTQPDARFIAKAPERISALLEEVEAQRAVIKTAIESYIVRVIKRDALPKWWTIEVPALGNRTPQQALDEGDGMAVLEVAVSYNNPSYS